MRLDHQVPGFSAWLPASLAESVSARVSSWAREGTVARIWDKDASVWTGSDESSWLGWLDIVEAQQARIEELQAFGQDIACGEFEHILLLGMGGSSLCPEVLKMTFGKQPGFPDLQVLDSTDPTQIRALDASVDLRKTLCIVSSKSGSTLEPNIFMEYFLSRMRETVGKEQAGSHFVAITDPGSHMQAVAEAAGFRKILFGLKSIGGRYSALSDFGMAPAAAMGLDVNSLLSGAARMAQACKLPADSNPGLVLGAVMGEAALAGCDKMSIVASPAIWDLGAWMEQLVAESTGKLGNGIIPIDLEPPLTAGKYGQDRLFIYIRHADSADPAQDLQVDAVRAAGHAVVQIDLSNTAELGAEFFRWEFATAVAGSVLGIHPFDQPDVEASKIATMSLTSAYEVTGSLPSESPLLKIYGLTFYADCMNAAALEHAGSSALHLMRAHLNRLHGGDYFGLLAYLNMSAENQAKMQRLRRAVLVKTGAATCLGFGPRFLHSTGQAYKGGPNTGVFLQITCDDEADLSVPGRKLSFGAVKAAQARGDLAVLNERGRRALRVHLGPDVSEGLDALVDLVERALLD